jgi:uncharacterized membrane protein YeaQ/YmgE (transglycosylase-associated protein family)
MIIGIIGSLIIGLIVGGLARLLVPGRDPMGCFMTALLGVIGSIVGGFIGGLLFPNENQRGYFRPAGFLMSLVGAILVLLVWRSIAGRKS